MEIGMKPSPTQGDYATYRDLCRQYVLRKTTLFGAIMWYDVVVYHSLPEWMVRFGSLARIGQAQRQTAVRRRQ